MRTDQLLTQILPILHSVKDDEKKLQQILDFLLEEIYEEPDDEITIPKKYQKLVHDIAESIDCGLVCFLNPDTLEMEDIPKTLLEEGYDLDEDEEDGTINLKYETWEKCITIEPRESRESFGIMESFIDEVNDKSLKKRLINALSNRRPFANFKNLIETSNYREQWFAFKQKKLEKSVWENLIGENLS
ncbi:MAG: UPF0158 family protein [Bacteroidetes bacterium]|nr:UPF0158 family protein [Bacteroidota bacterium]